MTNKKTAPSNKDFTEHITDSMKTLMMEFEVESRAAIIERKTGRAPSEEERTVLYNKIKENQKKWIKLWL